ncbi:MAG: nucleoside deaminase [bacterium]|nr:nucleoside deaminase [bacterium]
MDDEYYLSLAVREAKKGAKKKEVPVGAIVVKDNKVLAAAHNLKERKSDVTAHAEILAIKKASKKIGDWRLTDCTLYSTLEPCPMCAGAILHARIKRIVYGALDIKWGASGSITNLFLEKFFNHYTESIYIINDECGNLLKRFFKKLR